ncbi:hypothetical protein AVEN_135462-1 [Araneus ventricosus]|uniref:Uncharacterized protein n=1 Tax=Araneus ventricosus TaxID=182803 RepID=A0A4Y2BFN0_ARAVE|nr:hypothetical protein AVEN_135462-1 [Araneus ventricosus]
MYVPHLRRTFTKIPGFWLIVAGAISIRATRYMSESTGALYTTAFKAPGKKSNGDKSGNQSIGQHLSIHEDSFSNPTNRRPGEAVLVDWSKMMKFKAS